MAYQIWNRRYTGSKYKLSEWISELIKNNCTGTSFCDLFAGTAIMSQKMLSQMKELYINDLLYSNEIIYYAFFLNEQYSKSVIDEYKNKYQSLNSDEIEDNYFSINFGEKYFSYNDAKLIGYIREEIESNSNELSKKEKSILIASLLYSLDKSANTVGHYDAYIKGHKIADSFRFDLIEPYDVSNNIVHIFREDANELIKEISCDIVYIDPPYNSRQYSRFYHIFENVALWKKPELYGVALKPKAENMSEYCKNSATKVFSELISDLRCNYIVVSYNNTYNSKSSSSKNKIALNDIEDILKSRGSLMKFEKPYQAFNAGKTEFSDHREFIYIVKVGD